MVSPEKRRLLRNIFCYGHCEAALFRGRNLPLRRETASSLGNAPRSDNADVAFRLNSALSGLWVFLQ